MNFFKELTHSRGYHNFQQKLEYISLSLFTISGILTLIVFPHITLFFFFPIFFGGLYAISFIMKSFFSGPIQYDMTLIFPELSVSEELTKSTRRSETTKDISELKDELALLKKEIELLKR